MIDLVDDEDDRMPWVFRPCDDDGRVFIALLSRIELEDGSPDYLVGWMAECAGGREVRDALMETLRWHRAEWKALGATLVESGPQAMWTRLVETVCPGGMPMAIGRA